MTDEATQSATTEGRVVEGWTGRLFEDFAPGDIYYHPFGKTVTEADNQSFTLMTQNVAKTHVDRNFAKATEFGLPLVNSTLTLALVTGQSTIDLSMNVFANMGWDEVRMPNPVYEGDTIYSRSKVLSVRPGHRRHRGLQPGQQDRDQLPPHVHGVPAGPPPGRRIRPPG
jgi:itaconyl-CoA hydratase